MRGIEKGKITIYLSKRLPSHSFIDESGNDTGIIVTDYDTPSELRINVKDASDQADIELYGADVKNVKKATVTPYELQGNDVAEHDIAWIGVIPNGNLDEEDLSKPMNYNYTVDRVLSADYQTVIYFKLVTGK